MCYKIAYNGHSSEMISWNLIDECSCRVAAKAKKYIYMDADAEQQQRSKITNIPDTSDWIATFHHVSEAAHNIVECDAIRIGW